MDKLELVPKVFDKKTVMKNVRESRLDKLTPKLNFLSINGISFNSFGILDYFLLPLSLIDCLSLFLGLNCSPIKFF